MPSTSIISSFRRFGPAVLAGLALVSSAWAQTFVGSDDFNSGSSTKWAYNFRNLGNGTSNGTLAFTNSRLDFTKSAGDGSYFLGWDGLPGTAGERSVASFTTSWVSTLDVTNAFTAESGKYASIGFEVAGGSSTYSALFLSNGGGTLSVVHESGGSQLGSATTGSNTSALLRMSWDASTQNLVTSYSFNSGASFTTLNTQSLASLGSAATNGFYFEVFGSSNATGAISTGSMYADSFAVSAVPEPSTYAAMAGAAALGLAIWRRRQRAAAAAHSGTT